MHPRVERYKAQYMRWTKGEWDEKAFSDWLFARRLQYMREHLACGMESCIERSLELFIERWVEETGNDKSTEK